MLYPPSTHTPPAMPAILHTKAGKRLVLLALLLPCAAIAMAMITSRRLGRHIEATIQRVDHTHSVQTHLDLLQRLLVEVETAQRGFLLTDREEFLEPYTAARAAIPATLAALGSLIPETDPSAPRLAAVRAAVAARLDHVERTIELARGDAHQEAALRVSNGTGRALMDDARRLMTELRTAEAQTLVQSQERLRAASASRTRWIAGLLTGNLLLIGTLASLAWRYSRLNAFVKLCSWSRTVEYRGQWLTFEAFMHRRFGLKTTHGISPTEAKKFVAAGVDQDLDAAPNRAG